MIAVSTPGSTVTFFSEARDLLEIGVLTVRKKRVDSSSRALVTDGA